MDTMKTFRFTRPAVYGRGTPGHRDARSRQGYYERAATMDEARAKIIERHGFNSWELEYDREM